LQPALVFTPSSLCREFSIEGLQIEARSRMTHKDFMT
jgi:hypothetical protein